ncbi:MAG: HAMP domain-containing histidine kinase [Proteobacteria bacterium]|nr:MAG: HAMP domain-containing histidine kinase [Pseudomonadota bacterium]
MKTLAEAELLIAINFLFALVVLILFWRDRDAPPVLSLLKGLKSYDFSHKLRLIWLSLKEKAFPDSLAYRSRYGGEWKEDQREKLRRAQISFCIFAGFCGIVHFLSTDIRIEGEAMYWANHRFSAAAVCFSMLYLLRKDIFKKIPFARLPSIIAWTSLTAGQYFVTGHKVLISGTWFTISTLWLFMFAFCWVYTMALPPIASFLAYSAGVALIVLFAPDLSFLDMLGNGATLYFTTATALILMRSSYASEVRHFIFQREAADRQKEQYEREAKVGRMIAQVSHDLRAPLGNIESLIASYPDLSQVSHQALKESFYRMSSMIDALRHNEPDSLIKAHSAELDLSSLASNIRSFAEAKCIRIELQSSVSQKLWIDKLKFERAMYNLMLNAIEAAESLVRFELVGLGSELLFIAIDDGPGVSKYIRDDLYLRGVSHGKESGTGLGLFFVKQVVQGHGGTVHYSRSDGRTVFVCSLPGVIGALEPEGQNAAFPMAGLMTESQRRKVFGVSFVSQSLQEEIMRIFSYYRSKASFRKYQSALSFDYVVTNDQTVIDRSLDDGVGVLDFPAGVTAEEVAQKVVRRFGLEKTEPPIDHRPKALHD